MKNVIRRPEKTFSTASVKLRRIQYEHMFSALTLNADVVRRDRHFAFVATVLNARVRGLVRRSSRPKLAAPAHQLALPIRMQLLKG
jgi:hypothetical protein